MQQDENLIVTPRPVGALAGRQTVQVAPGSSLRTVVGKLVDLDVGVVLVREGEEVKGIVSERDLLDAVHEGMDLESVLVDDIMITDIITIDPTANVVDAGRLMIERGIRHLVVAGPDGGVVSIRAVMRSMLS